MVQCRHTSLLRLRGKQRHPSHTQRGAAHTIEKKAIHHFGLTDNIFEAGYLLKNGKMLDFSGKKIGGSPRTRALDHREVSFVFPEKYEHTMRDGYLQVIDDFEKETGALRISVHGTPESCDYNLQLSTYQNPTRTQRATLSHIHRRCPQLWYDVYFKNGNLCDGSSSFRLSDAFRTLKRCKIEEKD